MTPCYSPPSLRARCVPPSGMQGQWAYPIQRPAAPDRLTNRGPRCTESLQDRSNRLETFFATHPQEITHGNR